jgi:hypothetical protein
MFTWLKAKWTGFEAWCASWMPGLKTKIASGLGIVASGAAAGQEFLTNMPTNTFITTTQLSTTLLVLFILTFWFRRLANYNAPVSTS